MKANSMHDDITSTFDQPTFDQGGLRRVAARLLTLDNPDTRQAAERLVGRRLSPYGLDAAILDEEISRYMTMRH